MLYVGDLVLSGMTVYGPLMLGLAMLPGAVGVPVPGSAMLIAAGALVRQGIMNWQALFLFAWLGAMLSDLLCYTMGRWTGGWVRVRLNERYESVWHRAEKRFNNHGGWAVFTTCLVIRGLAIPTNLIAGGSRYPLGRFIAWDSAGKLLWISIYLGLGYVFSGQWQAVSEAISSYNRWLGIGVVLGISGFFLGRRLILNRHRTDLK